MIRKSFFLACVLLWSVSASALSSHSFLGDIMILPPHAGYHELETAHFKVIYPKKYEVEADASAYYLERAHTVLSKLFHYDPGHHCTVILADNQDFANGVTSVVGLQGIVLFLTAPDPYSSIGEYENWLNELIIHEYSHYLTLEQARGLFSFGRYLFGDLLFPNQFWPTWLAEGLAVYAETDTTQRGRGGGTYYSTLTRDGIYRARLGTADFLGFDEIMGPIPHYPFGEGPYFAGYGIVDELMQRHGKDAPWRLSEESSYRVPFFLNGTLENISRDASANEWRTLWASWIERAKKRLEPELKWLHEQASPDPQFITNEGDAATAARLSPDETRIAYFLHSGHQTSSVHVMDLATRKDREIDNALFGGQLEWSPDGKTLYYSKVDYDGPYALYSDLYAANVDSCGARRLTRGERGKDPALCGPDLLVYTAQNGRVAELRTFNLRTEEIRAIYRAPDYHHTSNPRCTADGKTVVFAEHGTEPRDAMYSVPITGAVTATHLAGGSKTDFAAEFPEPSPRSSEIYFTRLKDGYYDLAVLDPRTRAVRVVARSVGGYWMPNIGRKTGKIATSYVTSLGIRAALLDPSLLDAKSIARVSSAVAKETVTYRESDVAAVEPPGRVEGKRSNYSVFESLQPRIWFPFVLLGETQSQYGGLIQGWDDTDQLEYQLYAWYDTIPKKPQGFFATYHRIAGFRLGLAVSDQISDYFSSTRGVIYDEERKLIASLSRPLPGVWSSFTPTILAEWARTYRDGDFGKSTFDPDPRLGLNLTYDSRRSFSYSIVPERGLRAEALVRRFYSGDRRANKALLRYEQLIPFFPRHGFFDLTAYFGIAPTPREAIPQSTVKVGGKGTLGDLDPPLRGYPLGNFNTQRAAVVQAEYQFPLGQFFRGFDTFPVFLKNLGGYTFYDGAKLQKEEGGYSSIISSAGAGLQLNTILGYFVPLRLRLEFAHGMQKRFNGQNVVAFYLGF